MKNAPEDRREAREQQRAALQDEQPPKNACSDQTNTDCKPTPATLARKTGTRQIRK